MEKAYRCESLPGFPCLTAIIKRPSQCLDPLKISDETSLQSLDVPQPDSLTLHISGDSRGPTQHQIAPDSTRAPRMARKKPRGGREMEGSQLPAGWRPSLPLYLAAAPWGTKLCRTWEGPSSAMQGLGNNMKGWADIL